MGVDFANIWPTDDKRAAKIILWLGEEKDESGFVMRFVRRASCLDQPFLKLLQRLWFNRHCSAEEPIFPKEAHLRCGDESVTLKDFFDILKQFLDWNPIEIKGPDANHLVLTFKEEVRNTDDDTSMEETPSLLAL